MLDAGADFRLFGVGAAGRLGHGLAFGLLAMNATDEAVPLHECLIGCRAIGGVRPNAARCVGLIEQALSQTRALIGGGVGRRPFADEAEAAVDRNVVLIAEHRDREIAGRRRAVLLRFGLGKLHRPARVTILLAQLGRLRLPILGNTAFLDRLLLLDRVALPR